MGKTIGVITPLFNDFRIINAIKSVESQLIDDDIIHYICDDCSTDNSKYLVLDYITENKKSNIKLLSTETNAGTSAARNICLKEAEKDNVDFIAFLDSDDQWFDTHLVQAIDILKTGYDFVCSEPSYENDDGEKFVPFGMPVKKFEDLLTGNSIFVSSAVIKFQVVKKIGEFDSNTDQMADWDYWIRISLSDLKMIKNENVTIKYNVRPGSMATYCEDALHVIKEKYRFRHNKNLSVDEIEVPLHLDAIRNCKYGIVELGILDGNTTRIFCENTNLPVYGIDPLIPDSMVPELHGKIENIKSNTGGFANFKFFNDYSYNVVNSFQHKFDYIFIDADHTYNAVKQDFEDWFPKLMPGGYISFHDSAAGRGGPEEWHGPSKLVNELFNDPRLEYIKTSNSLTMFKKRQKMKKISVIIPTYNHLEDALKPCIESLIEKTSFDRKDYEFEIVVVSNGSTDGTKEYIERTSNLMVKFFTDELKIKAKRIFKLLWFDEALGYTKAVNKGIESATGDYIVLLNNDVVFLDYGKKDEWWEELIKPFNEQENVGLTGPHRLVCPATHRSFMVFFLVMTTKELLEKFKVKDGEYLDEIFNPGGGEDTDYCIKLSNAGYKSVRVPQELEDPFDQRNVTEFTYPVFHAAEATVHGDVDWKQFGEESWQQIFNDHHQILKERFLIDKSTEEKFKKQNYGVFNEVFETNSYFLYEFKTMGRNILDIGGHYGYFSYLCRKLNANEITIVEADPTNYDILEENLKDSDINCLNKVAGADGKNYTTRPEGPNTKVIEKLDGNIHGISFETLTEKFSDKDKNILKIDIEGSEYELLKNATTEALRKFERVFIEVHEFEENQKKEIILDKFKSASFSIARKEQIMFYFDENGKQIGEVPVFFYEFLRENKDWKPEEPTYYPDVPHLTKDDWKQMEKERLPEITATVSTKNRYHSTLPLTLTAIAKQTYKPKKLIIYDDGDHLDLRNDPLYQNIFELFNKTGIELWVEYAPGLGQVNNHQKALMNDVKTDWIWRLDDDNVPEDDVLAKLIRNIDYSVGAVAGLVLDPKSDNTPNPMASNKIEHFKRMLNEQWFRFPNDKPKEVDHLYSTFIYRREAAKHGYCMELSKVGHGEETLFSHGIKRNGYKLIIDPKAITWHFHYPQGGIRSPEMRQEMWEADDKIINRHLKEWMIEDQGMKIIVLDCGIGDHYAFKHIIEDVKLKYQNTDLSLAVCYPDVFHDIDGIALMSIGQALSIYGSIDQFSVYKWMADRNWKKSIVEAYKEMYL